MTDHNFFLQLNVKGSSGCRVNCVMTRTLIDMGNKLIVYLLTFLCLEQIQQLRSDWVEIMTETLVVVNIRGFFLFVINQ